MENLITKTASKFCSVSCNMPSSTCLLLAGSEGSCVSSVVCLERHTHNNLVELKQSTLRGHAHALSEQNSKLGQTQLLWS